MKLDKSWGKWLKANHDPSKPIKLNTTRNNALEKQRAIAGLITALRLIKGENK